MGLYHHDRSKTWNAIELEFGLDYFENATVLDVGCNEGYFCRKAIDAGARHAIGLEPKPARLKRALEKNRGYPILCSKLDYFTFCSKWLNVFTSGLQATGLYFSIDVSLCLNVLHHLPSVLEKKKMISDLLKRSKRAVIFEFIKGEGKLIQEFSNDVRIVPSPHQPIEGQERRLAIAYEDSGIKWASFEEFLDAKGCTWNDFDTARDLKPLIEEYARKL